MNFMVLWLHGPFVGIPGTFTQSVQDQMMGSYRARTAHAQVKIQKNPTCITSLSVLPKAKARLFVSRGKMGSFCPSRSLKKLLSLQSVMSLKRKESFRKSNKARYVYLVTVSLFPFTSMVACGFSGICPGLWWWIYTSGSDANWPDQREIQSSSHVLTFVAVM